MYIHTFKLSILIYSFLLVSDTLDDIMTESGDEEETEGIVNKVLDEIGIEISGKVILFLILYIYKYKDKLT